MDRAAVELNGSWRAIAAAETLRRAFADPNLDDGDWAEIDVPHHWRSHPDFAASDGPLLYRRRFETSAIDTDQPRSEASPEGADQRRSGTSSTSDDEPGSESSAADEPGSDWSAAAPAQDRPRLDRAASGQDRPETDGRTWLQLDGLFYQGDVWMNGSYLGDTEGYFFPHVFEVTAAMAARSEHLLAIELTCDRPGDKTAKRNLTGVFQHWDCFDQDWNPGGIWRPVHLFQTGPVRVAKLRVLCSYASAQRAAVEFRATLDARRAGQATVRTTLTGPSGAVVQRLAEHSLAAGANEVRWRVPVEQPALWWPHALGGQPLYDVRVAVMVDGTPSDERAVKVGLRQFRMRNFIATVNGERLFLKGSNQGPTKRELGEATPEQLEQDVVLAREAGLDLLRIHGHISRPELYDAADRHGMLLWQDLPLQWGYAGVRTQAIRQAALAVDLLGHHPSVAVWCGHNEPLAIDQPATAAQYVARQILPTWNKSVLDRSIQRALEKADSSRPVVAHSGVLPHPAWGTDSHLYYGWYLGEERELPEVLARVPVLARFVSEFGAQAVPDDASWCQPERWPDLDWAHLARAHGLQKAKFDRHVPPASYPTFDGWRRATQAYQAQVIRYHIETLRRLKYRPTGGFCQFSLGDGQPAVTWSVLDEQRRPKAGWSALAAACAPVIVVADRPGDHYRPGGEIRLAVHVVSDLRAPITDALCEAVLSWDGGGRTWRFAGDAGADSCVRVGLIRATAPAAPGPLVLDLDLTWPGGKAHNHYVSQITP